jgi:predicted GNAT family acetyltransferase
MFGGAGTGSAPERTTMDAADATVTLAEGDDRYEITVDGERIGLLDYARRGDVLDLHHTEIDRAYEGQGYGAKLVGDALADIRRRGLTIRPTCSFVAAYVRRHPADADLVAARSA